MGKGNLKRKRVSGRGQVETFALASVTVRNSQGTLLNGVSVEIKGVPPQRGQLADDFKGTTGKTISRNKGKSDQIPGVGVWFSGPFSEGSFDVVVSLDEYGPAGPVVRPAEVRRTVEFVSAFELPAGQSRVNVDFVLDPRNPRVLVKVRDGTFNSATPVGNADVEVIGTQRGKTDRFGEFTSAPVPFGRVGVNVSSPGMLSTATGSSVFFTEVELNPSGSRAPGTGNRKPEGVIDPSLRDIELSVELTRVSVVLPGTHPRPFALWASGLNSGHDVAEDTRLPSPGAGDTEQGQDGWDMGIRFNNLADLAAQLSGRLELPDHLGGGNIEARQLKRLAICSHGLADTVDVDQIVRGDFGTNEPSESNSLTPARFSVYQSSLEKIGNALAKDATVFLACCLVAERGEELIKLMSFLWPTVTIVALRSLGLTHLKQRVDSRGGDPDIFAGIRDSPFATSSKNFSEAAKTERNSAVFRNWSNLSRLPWFNERSPHATVVRDGSVIRRGNPALAGDKL